MEVGIFLLAFALIRLMSKVQSKKGQATRPSKKVSENGGELSLGAEFRQLWQKGPLSGDDLQSWAERILRGSTDAFLSEGAEYLAQHPRTTEGEDATGLLLKVPAGLGKPDVVEAFAHRTSTKLDAASAQEALVEAFGAACQSDKVEALLGEAVF